MCLQLSLVSDWPMDDVLVLADRRPRCWFCTHHCMMTLSRLYSNLMSCVGLLAGKGLKFAIRGAIYCVLLITLLRLINPEIVQVGIFRIINPELVGIFRLINPKFMIIFRPIDSKNVFIFRFIKRGREKIHIVLMFRLINF